MQTASEPTHLGWPVHLSDLTCHGSPLTTALFQNKLSPASGPPCLLVPMQEYLS